MNGKTTSDITLSKAPFVLFTKKLHHYCLVLNSNRDFTVELK